MEVVAYIPKRKSDITVPQLSILTKISLFQTVSLSSILGISKIDNRISLGTRMSKYGNIVINSKIRTWQLEQQNKISVTV